MSEVDAFRAAAAPAGLRAAPGGIRLYIVGLMRQSCVWAENKVFTRSLWVVVMVGDPRFPVNSEMVR